jgi:hypothetical protein
MIQYRTLATLSGMLLHKLLSGEAGVASSL